MQMSLITRKTNRIIHALFMESTGLKLEIALVFLIPVFIYLLALDMEFSQSLQIDRSTVALIAMVVMMFWFVFRRITELQEEIKQRRETELMLKEIEERYRALFDRSLDFVFICNFDGKFIDANDVMLDRLGYSREEFTSFHFIEMLPLDQRQQAQEMHSEIMHMGHQTEIAQLKIMTKSGEYLDIEVRGSVIYRWSKPYAIQGIARDISERIISENKFLSTHLQLQETIEQLQTSHKQLLQSEKLSAIGQLVSGVAHELNNPLMAISGYAEMLDGNVQGQEAKQYVATLQKEADRAIKIVGNLLSFARKREVVHLPVSINEVIKSVISLRSYELKLDNIGIDQDLAADLPNVIGDFQQLQQVFLNILLNAEQAIYESGIGERIIIQSREESSKIIIKIIDDGPGIPHDILNRVFEPFFTTKEVGKGTGLGLSICYGIIEDHGGTISCYSSEGNGATFEVRLPIETQISVPREIVAQGTEKRIPMAVSSAEESYGRE